MDHPQGTRRTGVTEQRADDPSSLMKKVSKTWHALIGGAVSWASGRSASAFRRLAGLLAAGRSVQRTTRGRKSVFPSLCHDRFQCRAVSPLSGAGLDTRASGWLVSCPSTDGDVVRKSGRPTPSWLRSVGVPGTTGDGTEFSDGREIEIAGLL